MFKVGDEVECLVGSKMAIIDGFVTCSNHSKSYPILVRTGEFIRTYTADGKRSLSDSKPSLFHKGTTNTINEAPEPKRLPDLEVNDLVWVWNENKENKTIRCFSHFSKAGYLYTFNDGYTSNGGHMCTIWWGYYEVYEK